MNLSHLKMTSGSIKFSLSDRVLTKDFILTDSELKSTSINGQYAYGDIVLKNNVLDNSRFYCSDCGKNKNNTTGFTNRGKSIFDNNHFKVNSGIEFNSHKQESIDITNNTFSDRSYGVEIRPDWYLTYYLGQNWFKGVTPEIGIKNNTFSKTNKGIYVESSNYDISGNKFIESPGIRYGTSQYSHTKGWFSFKINNNYFIKQKGENRSSNNVYAIKNEQALDDKLELKDNTFCSKDRVALRLSTNRLARMKAGDNYWNTTNKTSIQRNMVFDHLVDLDVKRTISYGVHNQERNPNLSSALELACAAEAEGSEPEDAPVCTLGGMILPGTPALDPASCSVYNIIEDVQIPKGVTLRANPGVKIEGKNKRIKVEGGIDFVGSKDSKIIINNTYIQPAGDPDDPTYAMNLSHLKMTSGSIKFSLSDRVLTKDFILTDSE